MANEELIDEVPPSWFYIRSKAATRRSVVNQYQASLFAKITLQLEAALLRKFEIKDPARLPEDKETAIFDLDEYHLWHDVAFACGFVCDNGQSNGDLDEVNRYPERLINHWNFPELRQYVHYLQRSEKWADGYSSPVFRAIRSGALGMIARRIQNDRSLYAP